ncbi:MAG: hypothetical protein GY782_04000, partial [Gammaproteobacteria bacterium]|nr:hypothetical protein [Gammaproteobacteria bacterium]
MENWDAIICDRNITREIAEAHMEKLRLGEVNNPYFDDKYLFFATGGTSGLRGLFVWDKQFHAACLALTHRYSLIDDEKLSFPDGKRLVALTAPTALHASTFLYAFPLDRQIESHHLPANISTNELIATIERINPTHLIGFTSVINRLAQLVKLGQLSCSPQRVSVNSEPLDDETRELISDVWGIGVNNGWGSLETGLDAIEDDTFSGLVMAEDYCVFEPVTAELQPTQDESTINKVLVASTFNYTFPLIRYVLHIPFYSPTHSSGIRPSIPFLFARAFQCDSPITFAYDLVQFNPPVY